MTVSVLVCGATGFVGRHLVQRLRESGHAVTGATRRPDAARQATPNIDWVFADVENEASLRQAMQGFDAVVYLVHQMRQTSDDLVELEKASARRVLTAAESAGVKRLVYLGGPEPSGAGSVHLEARLETGRILRSGSISTLELRAGMVIGAESESWLMVRLTRGSNDDGACACSEDDAATDGASREVRTMDATARLPRGAVALSASVSRSDGGSPGVGSADAGSFRSARRGNCRLWISGRRSSARPTRKRPRRPRNPSRIAS